MTVEANLTNTFGALEIGSSFAVLLFGIVTLQAHLYFSNFSEDRWGFKLLVAAVWFLELGHTILIAYEVYKTTITFYGRPEATIRFPGFGGVTIIGGLITMLVQNFFAYRVWNVLPKPWRYVGLLCATAAVARAVMSIYVGIQGIFSPSMAAHRATYQGLVTTLLVMGATIDVIIAVSMMSFLIRRRGKALTRVTRLIDHLIGWTVRTGLITSIAAVTVLVLFLIQTQTLVYLALYTCVAKLYSNSLLSALNARGSLRETASKSISVEHFPKSKAPRTSSQLNSKRPSILNQAISIEMKTHTEFMSDDAAYFQVPLMPTTPNASSHASISTPPPTPVRAYLRAGDQSV
ncbi:hypothetical protein B0H34DRAFT_9929 [Crassisporium funariophilum]|nr:hypothetical protein B0H34DRAFT_9929 [Crassisporium funariophilum]